MLSQDKVNWLKGLVFIECLVSKFRFHKNVYYYKLCFVLYKKFYRCITNPNIIIFIDFIALYIFISQTEFVKKLL